MEFPKFVFYSDGISEEQKKAIDSNVNSALKLREDEVKRLDEKVNQLTETNEKLKGQLEVLNNQLTENKKRFDSELIHAIAEKRKLEKLLDKIDFKGDSDTLSNKEIKQKIIASKYPELKFDDCSEDYLEGMFEAITSIIETESSSKSERKRKFDSQVEELNQVVSNFPKFDKEEKQTDSAQTIEREKSEKALNQYLITR